MADTGQSSSGLASSSTFINEKPVLVRVKRKAIQSCVEALWIEINERPLKRPFLGFEKLSLSDSGGKEELKSKKILVQHVETRSNSEVTLDILQSFMPNSADESKVRTKFEERRETFKHEKKQDQLLSRARQTHESIAKTARFEQIWKSRKQSKETMHEDSIHQICHLYDVVRVDVEELAVDKVEEQKDTSFEDNTILYDYLPLMREILPSAAAEIEADMRAYISKQASTNDYVYDLYTVKEDMDTMDDLNSYPLVQVDEDDYYDGPNQSEFESDDSNAEDNPLNDYPDEDEDEEEGEEESSSSDNESEEHESESGGEQSEEQYDRRGSYYSEEADSSSEQMFVDDDNDNHYDYDNDLMKWEYR